MPGGTVRRQTGVCSASAARGVRVAHRGPLSGGQSVECGTRPGDHHARSRGSSRAGVVAQAVGGVAQGIE
jgi:hypothetical protein